MYWEGQKPGVQVVDYKEYYQGVKPGLTGAGPRGPKSNDEIQWIFPKAERTALDRKMILSEVMRLAVEMMFSTHCYSFDGKVYRQTEGGPIGLRSTCAVARVVMSRWDVKFKQRLGEANIMTALDGRYVNDGRLVLYGVRAGGDG